MALKGKRNHESEGGQVPSPPFPSLSPPQIDPAVRPGYLFSLKSLIFLVKFYRIVFYLNRAAESAKIHAYLLLFSVSRL
jgi:hypothetical protein